MAAQKFSKAEALQFGWNTTKSNIGFFIVILLTVIFIQYVPAYIASLVAVFSPVLSIIIIIADLLINLVVTMGLIKIALRFSNNEKAEFADLFRCYNVLIKYIVATILYGLIVLIVMSLSIIPIILMNVLGLNFIIVSLMSIILAIPGSILSIKFIFYSFSIIDRGSNPIKALKESYRITTGAFWNLVFFSLLLGCINFLGTIALGIGLFVTIPMSDGRHCFCLP